MSSHHSIVAVYPSHPEVEAAVKRLKDAAFDLTKLSIVGRDYHTDEQIIGYYNAGDRIKYWGKSGLFWGGVWSILFGSAFLVIPGFGPLVVAGPLVSWLIGILEGAAVMGAFSALGASLYSLGIPHDSILRYETVLSAGKFVLIAQGSEAETEHARKLLHQSGADSLDHHQPTLETTPEPALPA